MGAKTEAGTARLYHIIGMIAMGEKKKVNREERKMNNGGVPFGHISKYSTAGDTVILHFSLFVIHYSRKRFPVCLRCALRCRGELRSPSPEGIAGDGFPRPAKKSSAPRPGYRGSFAYSAFHVST